MNPRASPPLKKIVRTRVTAPGIAEAEDDSAKGLAAVPGAEPDPFQVERAANTSPTSFISSTVSGLRDPSSILRLPRGARA